MSQLRIDETKTSIRRNKTLFYLSKTAFYFVYISFLLSDWSAYLLILHFPSVQFSKSEMSFTEKRSILSAAS